MAKNRGNSPAKKSQKLPIAIPESTNTERGFPVFSFRHLARNFAICDLSDDQKIDLISRLEKLSQMTWQNIQSAPKHGLGSEKISPTAIKPGIPARFEDAGFFLALRYSGLLPMVGQRDGDTFHIIWLESAFNTLYDHG